MSARAQIIITLPSLRKMLMEDVAWVSNHCPKQACISIQGQIQSSRGRLWQKSATLQCEDKVDIKKVFRLGKPSTEGKQRPLLIEFRDAAIKNRVLENLSKLRDADEQLRQISVTHDMTEGEREQCRELVKECRERQQNDVSGEWKYQVRGLPGDMRIVKLKK